MLSRDRRLIERGVVAVLAIIRLWSARRGLFFPRLMSGMQIAVTGMTVRINGGKLLMAGVMIGAVIGDWRQPGANAMPGAQQKCEH